MDLTFKYEESTVFALRSLYSKYGYSQYKMNKFEEYDLYVKNKDFLISDSVITFTDTNGKLMALKPDVTLSIVKNSKDIKGYVEKLYYNENVYRVSKGSKTFKEIMQVGLECIGDIDDYCIGEVITLAAGSLKAINKNSVLSISHLGILSAVLDSVNITPFVKSDIIKCIEEKNEHELKKQCKENGIDDDTTAILSKFISIYGSPDNVLPKIKNLSNNSEYTAAVKNLENILSLIEETEIKDMLQIDFSVVSDAKYYNGIVFKGFIEQIPNSVLSGGQYDKLMKKFGENAGAVGFAVYLDSLERFKSKASQYDTDVILLCDKASDLSSVIKAVEEIIAGGESVLVQNSVPENISYKRIVKWEGR